MSHFKHIFGHNSPEMFPIKPLPPIFLGPPTHNGAIAAREISRGVFIPPPVNGYIPPPPPAFEAPPLPMPQKGTVWGIITDCATGNPIESTVWLDGRVDHTTPQGKFEFKDVEPGNYVLYVAAGRP